MGYHKAMVAKGIFPKGGKKGGKGGAKGFKGSKGYKGGGKGGPKGPGFSFKGKGGNNINSLGYDPSFEFSSPWDSYNQQQQQGPPDMYLCAVSNSQQHDNNQQGFSSATSPAFQTPDDTYINITINRHVLMNAFLRGGVTNFSSHTRCFAVPKTPAIFVIPLSTIVL